MWRPSETTVKKLHKLSGFPLNDVKHWLLSQPIYQIYLPPPKHFRHVNAAFPRQFVEPNEIHQANLLFLSSDKGYKYALAVVDVATRYKDVRPIKTKKSIC